MISRTTTATGTTLGVSLTLGCDVGRLSKSFSVDSPTLLPVRKSDGLKVDTNIVYIEGAQFGRVDMSGYGQLGETKCRTSIWISDSIVTCIYIPRPNYDLLSVGLVVDGADGVISNAFSADAPALFGVLPSNLSPFKPALIWVQGRYFGVSTQSFTMRIAGSQCLSTEWVSDSSLSSRTAVGLAHSPDLVMTMQVNYSASLISPLTYDLPSWQSKELVNVKKAGNICVTVKGLNFGNHAPTHGIRIGQTACQESGWLSDSAVTCMSSAGVQRSSDTVITVFRRFASYFQSISYDVATLSSVPRSNLVASLLSDSAMLIGSNFGTFSVSISGRISGSACPSTNWSSNTIVSCMTAKGAGMFLSIALTLPRVTISSSLAFSYDMASAARAITFEDGEGVLIFGSNFAAGLQNSATARVGHTACVSSIWNSDSSIVCKIAMGYGDEIALILTLRMQKATTSKMFTYDEARFAFALPSNSGSSVYNSLTMVGLNFGMMSLSQAVRISVSTAEASTWISASSIFVRAAKGVSGRADISLVLSIQSSFVTTTSIFSFDSPKILEAWNPVPNIKAIEVTLLGRSFGTASYSLVALIGTYGCTATVWISDSSLQCKLNTGFVAGDVNLAAIENAKLCRMCGQRESLLGCSERSPGFCVTCSSCPRGYYRDCLNSLSSTGSCKPCPNEGEKLGDHRYFKDAEGDSQTMCSK